MARRLPPSTLSPVNGGKLITDSSPDEAGSVNYVRKVNLRRFRTDEMLREGDDWFAPNQAQAVPGQSTLPANVVGLWELDRPNGERALVAATRTDLYRYVFSSGVWVSIGTGFSSTATKWEGESLDGYLILNNGVNLPVTFRVEDSAVVPIFEMREMGIASVGTIIVYNGFLLCADVVEIQSTHMNDWMNGISAYGIVTSNLTNRIRYKIIWCDFGAPRNWAVMVGGTITAANKNQVSLDFPVSAFPVGSKLAVINAGPNGGTLGGQVGIDDGVVVTTVVASLLTLGTPADPTLTYPLRVYVTRFADTSTFSGSSSIQDDSSAIVRMKPLKGMLIVYRETSIFAGRYTGVLETPFVFRASYYGRNVPKYPDAIEAVEGNVHLYPTDNRFYSYDGSTEPEVQPVLDACRNLFFSNLNQTSSDKAFARHNQQTNEIFFFCPDGVLAYDYLWKTASFIDETYSSAAYIRKPEATSTTTPAEFMFVLAKGTRVLTYGKNQAGADIYTRRGVTYEAILTHGLGSVNDDFNEKDLITYVPHVAFVGTVVPVTINLFGCDNMAMTPELLCSVSLPNSDVHNLVETFYRNNYYQDEIRFTSPTRVDINARTWMFQVINSASATRS